MATEMDSPAVQTCPCCGNPVEPLRLLIDLETGVLTFGDQRAMLTRQEAVIFNALLKKRPSIVTRESLLNALYSGRLEQADIKIVDVFVCKLRKKLKPFDLSIETSRGIGYKIKGAGK